MEDTTDSKFLYNEIKFNDLTKKNLIVSSIIFYSLILHFNLYNCVYIVSRCKGVLACRRIDKNNTQLY